MSALNTGVYNGYVELVRCKLRSTESDVTVTVLRVCSCVVLASWGATVGTTLRLMLWRRRRRKTRNAPPRKQRYVSLQSDHFCVRYVFLKLKNAIVLQKAPAEDEKKVRNAAVILSLFYTVCFHDMFKKGGW